MASDTTPPNEELVLTGLIRAQLAATVWASALVSNRLTVRAGEPVAPSEDFAVIVRSDGGHALEPPTFLRRVGVRVFGPDGDDNHMRTSGLARWLVPVLSGAWRHAPEVADTRVIHGPYRVPATVGRPEMYLTAELILIGTPT